ncbi:MAG: hypothetical protein QOC78_189 [Solirubrobacteraceae bacterium]|jgi:uncharacterized YceG family protein|nr:hypothetical protein [Solirubrobacteraceae bacterium]
MPPMFGRDDDARQRTAAEREAARLERERRRAEREGRQPPEALPATDESQAPEPTWAPFELEPDPEPELVGDPDPQPDPQPDPDPEPEPEPVADEPPPARFAAPEPERDPDPQPTEPLEPVHAGAPVAARRTVSLPRPQTEELGHHTDSWDRPIGTRRVARSEYQPQPGAPGMPPHRRIGVPRGRRGLRRVVPFLVLLVLVAIAAFCFLLFQPFHGTGYGSVTVQVPSGSSAGQIGDLLASKGVVRSGFFFSLRARLDGDRANLRAGTYQLKRAMPYGEALAALTTPPRAAATIRVTLPEGPSRGELAPRVRAAGVSGSYVAASARSTALRPASYGAPPGTRSLEGFLFPDTYELRRSDATATQLVADQLATFKRQFAKVDLSQARKRNLSGYDVLTIASMIEREALVPKDRRLIAAVIYNRLRQGMALGIDATLRYRLGNWTRPLRVSELSSGSAYNTRKHKGLPPTPIGNPGLASIQAAANPASVGFLFYVVKPCGNGTHAFSSTDAQFQRDVAAYNRARAKRGGKDPSRC